MLIGNTTYFFDTGLELTIGCPTREYCELVQIFYNYTIISISIILVSVLYFFPFEANPIWFIWIYLIGFASFNYSFGDKLAVSWNGNKAVPEVY